MAIYKPTNCTPFLTTFDLRVESRDPAFFECRIDSSNRNIAAYSIVVYDEDNVQVFPIDASGNPVPADQNISFVSYLGEKTGNNSTQYLINNTGYSYLNTGINGTYLRIPFVVNIADAAESNNALYFKSTNALYYDPSNGTLKAYAPQTVGVDEEGKRKEPSGNPTIDLTSYIQNGYTYKWRITLYQGDAQGNVPPSSILYYDMLLTSGQTLGSNTERIQSVLSDEIYIDYYIQPVHIDGLSGGAQENPTAWTHTGEITNIGPRARIKNYDSTYGYIYPQTGSDGILVEAVDQKAAHEGKDTVANGFRVFSMSNDPNNLSVTRKASQVLSHVCVPFEWQNYVSDDSLSYGQLVYYAFPSVTTGIAKDFEGVIPNGTVLKVTNEDNSNINPFSLVKVPVFLVSRESESDDWKEESEKSDIWIVVEIEDLGASTIVDPVVKNECSTTIARSQRFILNAQFDTADGQPPEDMTNTWENAEGYAVEGSRYNGIYAITDSISGPEAINFRLVSEGTVYTINQYSLMFQRTTDADTWGEIYNKIVYIERGEYQGTNVQIQREEGEDGNANGTINSTSMKWGPEIPLNIYDYTGDALTNNPDINSVGLIFYNDYWEDGASSYEGRLYLRPYVGLTRGMYWQEQGPVRSTNMRQFVIDEVNTDYWYVKYHFRGTGDGSANFNDNNSLIDIGTRYQIKSYFRESDENPFDLYANPEITIQLFPSEAEQVNEEGESLAYSDIVYAGGVEVVQVPQRSFWAKATFDQENYISWKSYRWFLYSGLGTSGTLLQSTETEYGGIPANLFYGLQNGVYYTIVLIMESNTGMTMQKTLAIQGVFTTPQLENFPFNLQYDCTTHSASLSFSVTGYILPNAQEEGGSWRYQNAIGTNTISEIAGVSYSEGSMIINSATNGYDFDQGVEYGYVVSHIQVEGSGSYLQFSVGQGESAGVVVETQVTINVGDYCGQVVGYETGLNDSEGYIGSASLELPEALEEVEYNHSVLLPTGETVTQTSIRKRVDEDKLYSFWYYDNTSDPAPGSHVNIGTYNENGGFTGTVRTDGRWDAVVGGDSLQHPIFNSWVVSPDFSDYAIGAGSGNEPIFADCVNIVANYGTESDKEWHYAWDEGEGETQFDFNISYGDEDTAMAPPLTDSFEGWTSFQPNDSAAIDDNSDTKTGITWSEFHVRGPAPFIWSDFNLIRREVATGGQKTVSVGTQGELSESFEIVSDGARFLEDYKSVWKWPDENSETVQGGGSFVWSDGIEKEKYSDENKMLPLLWQKGSNVKAGYEPMANTSGKDIYDVRKGLENVTFKIKIYSANVTQEAIVQGSVYMGKVNSN